jgi:hypothetical protein
MQVIENLIKNRDLPKGNELRDLHIFHYYNEAVQLYDDITIAIDKTVNASIIVSHFPALC